MLNLFYAARLNTIDGRKVNTVPFSVDINYRWFKLDYFLPVQDRK